jgi:hypothetical protein
MDKIVEYTCKVVEFNMRLLFWLFVLVAAFGPWFLSGYLLWEALK